MLCTLVQVFPKDKKQRRKVHCHYLSLGNQIFMHIWTHPKHPGSVISGTSWQKHTKFIGYPRHGCRGMLTTVDWGTGDMGEEKGRITFLGYCCDCRHCRCSSISPQAATAPWSGSLGGNPGVPFSPSFLYIHIGHRAMSSLAKAPRESGGLPLEVPWHHGWSHYTYSAAQATPICPCALTCTT